MAYEYHRAQQSIREIATIKQDVFEHSYKVFEQLRSTAEDAASQLSSHIAPIDSRVKVEFKDENRNEFWLQFGGDLLIFSLHTNVFSFDKSHSLFSSNYIQEDHRRAYFCMIEVFNFLNDSVVYNRNRDIGEMIARVFVNADNHFFVEGIGAIGSLYADLSTQKFEQEMMSQVLESAITSSINYDLWAPAFNDVRFLPVQAILDKNGNSPRTTAKRLGFDISGS